MASMAMRDMRYRAGKRSWLSLAAAALVAFACACVLALGSGVQSASAQTLAEGDTFKAGGNKYVVTDIDDDGEDAPEAVLVKYGAASKTPTVNTVRYAGERFEVEAIGAGAFDTAKGHRVTAVTIGRNVDEVGSGAFDGCKKLKTINLRKADFIEVEMKRGAYRIDDLDAAYDAFSNAGVKGVKVLCGKKSAAYRKVFKKALVKAGLRSDAKVVK